MNHGKRIKNKEIIEKYVKRGDFLIHTGCMGMIYETKFIRFDGNWICGNDTTDTMKIHDIKIYEKYRTDISPLNVTHINRVPICDYHLCAQK